MRDIRGMRRDVICATGDAQRVAGTSGDADAHAPCFFMCLSRCLAQGVRLWKMFEGMLGTRGDVVEDF